MKKGLQTSFFLMVAMMAIMVVPELASAQITGNGGAQITTMFNKVMPIFKFGLGLYSAWKWFQYFASFNPSSAFLDIIVPALMTFLAFQLDTVLGWFKLS